MQINKLILGILFYFCFYNAYGQENSLLIFEFNIDSVYFTVDYEYEKTRIVYSGDSLFINSGNHRLEFSTPFDEPIVEQIFLGIGSVKKFSLVFDNSTVDAIDLKENYASKVLFNKDVAIATDDNSEIYINGEYVTNGFTAIDLNETGTLIRVQNPKFGSKSFIIEEKPYLNLYEVYRQPSKKRTQVFSLVPGLSQFYKKQYLKSGLFAAGSYALLGQALVKRWDYFKAVDDYNLLVYRYDRVTNEEQLLELGNRIETERSNVVQIEKERNILYGATAILYIINILDGLFVKPKYGYQSKQKNVELYLTTTRTSAGINNMAAISVNF